MEDRKKLKYSRDHEWIHAEEDCAMVGITHYAQLQLGDIVYVEIPNTGLNLQRGDVICALESVKTAADIYSPVSGIIEEANLALDLNPEIINESPYEAWIVRIRMSDLSELDDLMDEADYAAFTAKEE